LFAWFAGFPAEIPKSFSSSIQKELGL